MSLVLKQIWTTWIITSHCNIRRFGRSWWTKEDYKKASKWDKLFFYFIVLCLFYLCFTTGLNCILHPTSQHSPVHLMNEISFSLTVFTCGCGILWTNWRRNSLSNVLTTVNEKSLAILKTESDRRNYRQRRNRIQCFSIGLFTTFQTFAIFDIISFCVQFFVYGRAQFFIFFAANSFLENFQFFLHMVVNLWLTIYTPSYFTIIIEIFLRITLNYDILTYNLRNIGNWQEENREKRNYSQFKFAMKELSELQSVIEDMNSVISPYIAAWIALTINTTGILVANMTVVNSSGEALSCLPLLVWFISFLVTFCILGQFVSDSVSILY